MNKAAIIIMLIFPIVTFAQRKKSKAYKNIPGLKIPSHILYENIVGKYHVVDTSYNIPGELGLTIDSNGKFIRFAVLLPKIDVDSGRWFIKHKNKLVLKSSNRHLQIYIYEFHQWYFLILPQERKDFFTEFKKIRARYFGEDFIKIDENTTGTDQLTGWELSKKFRSVKIGGRDIQQILFWLMSKEKRY